tara:strand:+ start:897 stop:1778 length:882 start_codon:yes stop_codon:yes gene_type:complete
VSFLKDGSYVAFDISAKNVITRPALAGAWIEVYLKGRVSDNGINAIPLSGSLQINAQGPQLPWPRFDLYQTYQPQAFNGNETQIIYAGHVGYPLLEAFEKERAGKDFSVHIQASLRVHAQNGAIEDWNLNGHESLHKNVQEWGNILSSAGYRKYLFHDLSFPADGSERENSVYSLLYTARALFESGLYRECVARLRQAEERLRERRKDKRNIFSAMEASASNSRAEKEAMTLDQRLFSLRGHMQNVLHSAAHEAEPDSSFTREKAKLLLITVSAMVELFPEPTVDLVAGEKDE